MSKPKPSPHRGGHTHTRAAHPWAAWETGLGAHRNQGSSEGQVAGRAGSAQSRNLRQEAEGSPSLLVALRKSQRHGDSHRPRWGALCTRGRWREPGGLRLGWGRCNTPQKQRPIRKESFGGPSPANVCGEFSGRTPPSPRSSEPLPSGSPTHTLIFSISHCSCLLSSPGHNLRRGMCLVCFLVYFSLP